MLSFKGFLVVAFRLGLLALPLSLPAATNASSDPPAVYLTWQHDAATSMTVQWHTDGAANSELEFRTLAATNWTSASGTDAPLPRTSRFVHVAELTGLTPKTDYEFRFASDGPVFKFRTMPKNLDEPVRFVEGGDMFHQRDWMDQMNALAAKFDPAFVLIGGDLAYSFPDRTDRPERMDKWFEYFDSWKKNAVTPDGRLIPLLVAIGNHEVKGFWGKTPESAPGFYTLFATPGQRGYAAVDFGNYLSVLLLDSGLTHPIDGAQTDWLAKTLSERRRVPNIIPVYHIPAFPSCRPDEGGENGEETEAVRKLWCPLFEKFGVRISFEHHDHAYKRTFPLRAGRIDSRGIIYLGDGAWGVRLRKPDAEMPRWYIAKTGAIRHFYVVTLYSDQRHILAVNDRGEIFDEVYQRAAPAK